MPITLVILLFAFGALVAALLPVGLAFTGFLGALGVSALVSHLQALVRRDKLRDPADGHGGRRRLLALLPAARAGGAPAAAAPREALRVAAATSGQAVLVSGVTVLIAMAGMLLAGNPVFTSIGIGTMIMISVAIVGSLTILPALLSKLGDRVDRGPRSRYVVAVRPQRRRVALLGRGRSAVMRRPALALCAAAARLLVLALPALGMHTRLLSYTDLPRSLPVIKAYERHPGGVSRRADAGRSGRQGEERARAAVVAAGEELVRRALATRT